MLKKFMAMAATGAAMLSVVGVAAAGPMPRPQMPQVGVHVDNDYLKTTVKSMAVADTGDNFQYGKVSGGQSQMPSFGLFGPMMGMGRDNDVYQKMSTGDAYASSTAYANVASTLNMPECALCTFMPMVSIHNDHLRTYVSSTAFADTGDNTQTTGRMMFTRMMKPGSGSGDVTQKMYTGDAAAWSDGSAFVGYTDFGVEMQAPAN